MVQNATPGIQRKDTGKIHLIWFVMAFKHLNLMNMGGVKHCITYSISHYHGFKVIADDLQKTFDCF